MSRLEDRLERDLREIAAGAHPSPTAWDAIAARFDDDAVAEVVLVPAPTPDRSRRTFWLVAGAAAAAIVVIAASIAVLTGASDDRTVSAADLTRSFVSPRNGFSISYPEGATVRPATQLWGWGEEPDDGFDVVDTGSDAVFRAASTIVPDTHCLPPAYGPPPCGTIDEQVDEHVTNDLPGTCGVPRDQQAEITIYERTGRVVECPNHIEATIVFSGRLYVFALSHDRGDARELFDAFLSTVELTPLTAIDYPPPNATFNSRTNGYTFSFFDRGGLQPATEPWDPANQPIEDRNFDERFDSVETGLAAYFEAASTPIPDGISIDEWVDQYVTPLAAGGCGIPRSERAEITIDGHPGRVAECEHTEATVVAGGRLYLFVGPGRTRRNIGWFHAWIATVDLHPETAAAP